MIMIVFLLLISQGFVDVGGFCAASCQCSMKDMISCTDVSITDIASLSIPNNFTYVIIRNTQATELTDLSFQPMPVTLRLLLESNKFFTISPAAFHKFPLLKSLKLTDNKLRTLPLELFHTLSHLEQLFLDRNALEYLDAHMFDNQSKLEELFLNRNSLKELPAGLLDHLGNLKVLHLSRNKLTDLPMGIFNFLSNLTILTLYDNRLVEIRSWMFYNLTELVELSLYSNLIQVIDKDAFYQLPKLTKLSLQKNRLKTLPDGLFLHLPSLSTLSLFENPLMELPTVLFGEMDYLKSLWLYQTDLSTIPNSIFSNLTNLQLLVLTMNAKLHSLPPDAFSGLKKLVALSLHTNNLSFLDEGLFWELQQLQNVSLNNNNFKVLPENLFHSLKNIQNVHLNNNALHTLPGNLFKELSKLQKVYLYENPWVCDCKLKDFKEWLEQNKEKVQKAMSLVCTSPVKGIPVLEVNTFVCPYSTTTDVGKSFYVATTSSTSPDVSTSVSQNTQPFSENLTSAVIEQFDIAMSPTNNWYYHDSTKASLYTRTTTETYDLHNAENTFWFTLPCGKIISYLLMLNAAMQMFLILLVCFILLKITKLYNYFNSTKDSVVLMRILIPLSSMSQVQNNRTSFV